MKTNKNRRIALVVIILLLPTLTLLAYRHLHIHIVRHTSSDFSGAFRVTGSTRKMVPAIVLKVVLSSDTPLDRDNLLKIGHNIMKTNNSGSYTYIEFYTGSYKGGSWVASYMGGEMVDYLAQ